MADPIDALTAAEQTVADEVRAVLDDVAAEIAGELTDATEIVAARFSLARIGRMWTSRVPRIVRRLLGVAETAAGQAASDAGTELPDGWDDLPGRHDQGDDLPASLGSYVTDTEHLLRAIGDRLTAAAVAELAAGLDNGEDIAQLRARLRALFSQDGAQLGETREERIARTESTRAWNAATLAAAQDLTSEGRPLVKQWQTRRDTKVRDTHDAADGQLRLLDEVFTVGGTAMAYPGDPAAPPELTVNCRCVLRLAPEQQAAAYGSKQRLRPEVFRSKEETAAADGSHLMGGMIALLPRDEDAQFLALPDGEDAGELHCTLWFLGDNASEWTEDQRNELVASVRARAADLPGPVTARAFGVNHWNPDSESPAWVWAVGDDRDSDGPGLLDARGLASWALEDTHERPDTPVQHSPWAAHCTAVYTADTWPFEAMCERLGAITFDRIRIAFAGDHYDIPLGLADVSAADVWDHVDHGTHSNSRRSAARSGGPSQGAFEAGDERLSHLHPRSVEAASVGVAPRRAPGERDPRRGGGEVGAADRAERGRTPHLSQAALRRGDAPPRDAAGRPQQRARGAADAGPVHGARPPVRPAGQPGLGRMPGVREGGDGPLQGGQLGQGEGVRASGEVQGSQARGGQGAPRNAGVQGEGRRSAAGSPSTAETGATELRSHGDLGKEEPPMATPTQVEEAPPPPLVRTWSTPDGAALAFEDQQTGDGRVFAPGALYWDGSGPWPLQYAEAMGHGHDGAELAGAIQTVGRDASRITGSGVLYLTQAAGYDAALLLDQEAPLGVSVDLDDADVQLVDTTTSPEDADAGPPFLEASFASASVMRLADGAWMITGRSRADWTASGAEMAHSARSVMLFTSPGGTITAATARRVFGDQITAAAGDSDPGEGVVFHEEKSGDFLVRITRARLRGATLVAMPAYDKARIVLDPIAEQTASAPVLVASSGDGHERVVSYVRTSPTPVSARHLAAKLAMSVETVHGHLNRALEAGTVVRIARGQYVGASTLPEGHVTAAAPDDTEVTPAPADEVTTAAALDALYDERGAELVASAWQVMQAEGAMPAAWFREPTPEELPPGSGGVHIVDGRAYGWVAKRGVPHAAHGRKVTIEKLAKRGLDLSHFLRAKFRLDDGSEVRAGAMTMNVGHHRDGYECESAVCQFDDTRTVAAVVTVGMNEGGLWFSGAAAPWLSPWDRTVFAACQPSYHMTQGSDGRWQLRAVLSVPVPGHSSPLTAATVVDRSNLALTAAAAVLDEVTVTSQPPAGEPEPEHDHTPDQAPAANVVDQVTAALLEPGFLDQFADALKSREEARTAAARAELAELTARLAPVRAELAASAATQQEGN
ncbi:MULTISPECIES: phage minor head protein [Streptomyces]|uniref:Phage minor head protein n=1 Tax=Streptomyces sp. 900129855 TaxID=3155129 RepID=A0ABV2ZZ61_9ACTN